MTNPYEDDPRSPSVATGRPTTGPLSSGWVDARPQPTAVSRWDGAPPAVIQYMPPAAANTDNAWQSPDSTAEVGSPANRATATVIRGAPLLLLAIPAAVALAWLLGAGWAWGVAFFAALGVLGYMGVVLLDLQHNSPFSTERFRIAKAAELKRQELRDAAELRRMVVESYLKHLDGGGHD